MAVTRKTKGDRVFDVVNFIILLLICLIVAYPLYFVIIASISDPNVVNKGGVIFWPKGATLLGYQKLSILPPRKHDKSRGVSVIAREEPFLKKRPLPRAPSRKDYGEEMLGRRRLL